jgi:hypothetical protein
MNRAKTLSIALILVLAASSILTSLASAQITKPETPELTAKFVDYSYDVPETMEQNQYTGEISVIPAHRVQNYTVELTIKNPPYTPAPTEVGGSAWTPEYRYDVNVKGAYAQNWTIMYLKFEGPKPSNTDYTIIAYRLVYSPTDHNFELTSFYDSPYSSNSISSIPVGSALDFRVRAMVGFMHRGNNANETNPLLRYQFVFDGEISEWSSTQTVKLTSAAGATAMPTATETPAYSSTPDAALADNLQVNDLVVIVIAASAAIIMAIIAVAAVLIKRAKTQTAALTPN